MIKKNFNVLIFKNKRFRGLGFWQEKKSSREITLSV